MIFSREEKDYLNFIPYNPKKLFGNWNFQFYSKYKFEDIVTLDSAENFPTQFVITRKLIKETKEKLGRKIDIVITAVGTGSIVDLIEKNLSDLGAYINSITLTDLKDIDLNRWESINQSEIILKKKMGNILDPLFVETLRGDFFYGNELFGDIPNRFIYKKNNKYYDIWIRVYSKNKLPALIKKKVKEILRGIYYRNRFPEIFTPAIGKILSFEIAFRRRIFSYELKYYYEKYPDESIIPVPDTAFQVLYNLYERVNKNGVLLFNDYGFFIPENIHFINNFMKKGNPNYEFVRNYYGEFTTDPAYDFLFYKLKNFVKKISIKKTVDRISEITKIPVQLICLDGEERKAEFFIDLIRERFKNWEVTEEKKIDNIVEFYINSLKGNTTDVDKTIDEINISLSQRLSEEMKLTLKKILLGYFNDDDHRFLTIEINK